MALQSSPSFDYDVFISFRGSDTRFSFTGNLYHALVARGIRTFIDDRELKGGDEITPSLFKAIENSKIAIIVFSEHYASSSFCLDELSHIMKFFTENNRLVLPVFYGVEPTHIRHHTTGSYGEAITKHEKRFQENVEKYGNYFERLQKWKKALTQASNLSGYHLTIGSEMTQYEYKFIESIIDKVSIKVNRTLLHVADYCVGLETRVLQVKSLLNMGSDGGVCIIVGIHGIGGIGKTTLAKQVYNSIANQFEVFCFLDDVREKTKKLGLVHHQETLLHETIGEKGIRLGSVFKGIEVIKQRLQIKKVLLILDDVDDLKQLKNLVGEPNWFGPGSKVIVTTRDKELLASHKIERTYEVKGLNPEEALELLRFRVSKNKKVDSSYERILKRVVNYASGLPLALEVMGSTLSGKEHMEEWESLLSRYERIPHKDIQKILEVSYDSLGKEEQEVFLDIACCFKGYVLSEVERILCAHYGECMKCHIQVLVEKSLIKIDREHVRLHDLVEAMGKEIVRRESPTEPGERSRLWFHEDIVSVLENNTGTSQIKILHLNFPLSESRKEYEIEWDGDELKNMINLKTLIIKNGRFSNAPHYIPNNLRVLEWYRYPSQYLPADFRPKLLSMCTLSGIWLTSFGFRDSLKKFRNMKELNLDSCVYLTHIDDLSGMTNLETLSFKSCWNLTSIHDSVGFLNKLKVLNAWDCIKLSCFPPLKLTSLEDLKLSRCSSLKSFPEILGEMKNIKHIRLLNTCIEEFPASFQNLTGLESLDVEGGGMLRLTSTVLKMSSKFSKIYFEGCIWPSNTDELNSMVSSSEIYDLRLPNCNVSDEFLPKILTVFANMTDLCLSRNNITILPECLKECHFLIRLYLNNCKFLEEIRGIPPNLEELKAWVCKPFTSPSIRMLLDQKLHENGGTYFVLPRTDRVPEWFDHQSSGPSITFWFRNSLPSIALFVRSISMCEGDDEILFRPRLSINGDKFSVDDIDRGFFYNDMRYDHTYLYDVRLQDKVLESEQLNKALLKNEWIRAEVTFEHSDLLCTPGEEEEGVYWKQYIDLVMKPNLESGIHVFKQKSSMEDIRFKDPYIKKKLDEYLNTSLSHSR